ncbi:MAG: hypothetical protein HQK88_11460 [Nitrospirae bacterium]|nr:hypothetical protein [Nitrospirota bacterium]
MKVNKNKKREVRMKKSCLVLVLLVLMVGASYAGDISGMVSYVDSSKGVLTVHGKDIDVGFDCNGSMLNKVNVGDMVKVEYAESKDGNKAKSVVRLDIKEPQTFTGKVEHLNVHEGILIIGGETLLSGFSCEGSLLTGVNVKDKVTVTYIVEKGNKIARSITKM